MLLPRAGGECCLGGFSGAGIRKGKEFQCNDNSGSEGGYCGRQRTIVEQDRTDPVGVTW